MPYCRQACSYCDFYFTTNPATRPQFALWVERELLLRLNQLTDKSLRSIYLGGGTPSLLDTEALQHLFLFMQNYFDIEPEAEITLEANADDISPELLLAWREMGINRLSVGVQSFRPEVLHWMNRAHTAAQAAEALQLVKAQFHNYTVDLIFGVPVSVTSDADRLAKDVEELLAYRPPHISIYGLTSEPQTLLHHWIKKGEVVLDEDQYAREFVWLHDRLTAAGYEHYEVSNYALPGYRARHNGSYWQGKDYLGIGPSAHGYLNGVRYANVSNLHQWQEALQQNRLAAEVEQLDADARYTEYLMTRLRTATGLPVHEVRAFGQWVEEQEQLVQQYMERGWLVAGGTHWQPTVQGWLLLDTMIAELL